MPIISVVSRKGGVGKSTIAANLAACLAEQGETVLAIDADPQGALSWYLGADTSESPTLAAVIASQTTLQAASQTTASGVSVVPADSYLAASEIWMSSQAGREAILGEHVGPVADSYDWVLIDSAPGMTVLALNAMCAGDWLLMPVLCEGPSIEATAQTLSTAEDAIRRFRLATRILGAVGNRYQPRVLSHEEVLGRIAGLGVRVLSTHVRQTVRVGESFEFREPMVSYEPQHAVAEDFRRLAREVTEYVQT